MKLYRGQPYGAPLGSWWTTRRAHAAEYARQHRDHVVLRVDVDGRWARAFLRFDHRDADGHQEKGAYYRIPMERLVEQAYAVDIAAGRVSMPRELVTADHERRRT